MNLIRMGAIAALAISCAGCAGGFGTREKIIEKKYTQYSVPEEKFECSVIKSLPKPQGVTDAQVARLLTQLYHDNKQCYMSMEGLKTYLRKADAEGRISLPASILKRIL
jgi:hypothetical protein